MSIDTLQDIKTNASPQSEISECVKLRSSNILVGNKKKKKKNSFENMACREVCST